MDVDKNQHRPDGRPKAAPSGIIEASKKLFKSIQDREQAKAEEKALKAAADKARTGEPSKPASVDKDKVVVTRRLKPPSHELFAMHEMVFNCEGVVADGLDQLGIQRVLQRPDEYPEETVQNVRFMIGLVRRLQNVPKGSVPLAYYWQWPDIPAENENRLLKGVKNYNEQGNRPLCLCGEEWLPMVLAILG